MYLAVLSISTISLFLSKASAWGTLGHCTVAYLAESLFTDAASIMVNNLLRNDQGWDICDASTWADKVKHRAEYAGTDVWHYIDAADHPPSHCEIHFEDDCNRGKTPGCVISAITTMTSQLSTSHDPTKRKEALMFLIHLIGDAHQPLHTENMSRGGNDIKICFYDDCGSESKPMELHGIWDKEIPMKHRGLKDSASLAEIKAEGKRWAAELTGTQDVQGLRPQGQVRLNVAAKAECLDITTAQKCSLLWAGEANRQVCETVLKGWPFTKKSLGKAYFDKAVPVVDTLIGKAGVRLGGWINAIAAAAAVTDGGEQHTMTDEMGDGEL